MMHQVGHAQPVASRASPTFRERIVQFLEEVTERWDELKSYVTDNFRIITHEGLTFVDGSE